MKLAPTSRLSNLADHVRSSLWFLPAVAMVCALLVACGMVLVDTWLEDSPLGSLPWIANLGAGTAQLILSTLAGSIMTVSGVVFSITVVSLTLASSQFGPRLLRSFMRDRMTQGCFGMLLGTFLYCLVVLVTIGDGGRNGGRPFVPELSVVVAVGLAIGSVGVVTYFVHRVASSIQVANIIASVADELCDAIEVMFPEPIGDPEHGGDSGAGGDGGGENGDPISAGLERGPVVEVRAECEGYVRVVRSELLLDLAREHDLVIDLLERPGSFVVRGMPIMRVATARAGTVPDEVAPRLAEALITGPERTAVQDLAFPIDQIVEVALRALSPGINDPETAVRCADRLSQAMARLANRRWPTPVRVDSDGNPRVLAPVAEFGALLRSGFERIARAATRADAREVRAAIARALRRVAAVAKNGERREQAEELARELTARADPE